MRGVDHIVAGVDVVPLDHGLKKLGLVHNALLHEVEQHVLEVGAALQEVIDLDSDLVLQLALLLEEIGLIAVVEVRLVLGQHIYFVKQRPVDLTPVLQRFCLEFDHLAAAQQRESAHLEMQRAEIPQSGHPECVQQHNVDVVQEPAHLQGVVDVHPEAGGAEQLVEDIGVLEVDCRVQEGVAGVEHHLSLTVEFDRLGGLVDAVVTLHDRSCLDHFGLVLHVLLAHVFNVVHEALRGRS